MLLMIVVGGLARYAGALTSKTDSGTDGTNGKQSFFFTYGRHAALRMGNWKIVREKPNQMWKLYNLARDDAESKNLASERPADVARLIAEFQKWLADVKRPVRRSGAQ